MLTENEDTKIGRGNTLIKVFPPIGREKSINSGYTSMNEEVKGMTKKTPLILGSGPIEKSYRFMNFFVHHNIILYKRNLFAICSQIALKDGRSFAGRRNSIPCAAFINSMARMCSRLSMIRKSLVAALAPMLT